jgi:hypothetical protein
MRLVTVHLIDSSGRSYSGLAISVRKRDGTFKVSTHTGTEVAVPCGDYKIVPLDMSDAIYLALEEFEMNVTESGPSDFTVRVPGKLAYVEVRPQLPAGDAIFPVEVYIDTDTGHGANAMNWRPSRGPIRRLLDGSRVSVRIRSIGYEDVNMSDVSVEGASPFVIEARLIERAK